MACFSSVKVMLVLVAAIQLVSGQKVALKPAPPNVTCWIRGDPHMKTFINVTITDQMESYGTLARHESKKICDGMRFYVFADFTNLDPPTVNVTYLTGVRIIAHDLNADEGVTLLFRGTKVFKTDYTKSSGGTYRLDNIKWMAGRFAKEEIPITPKTPLSFLSNQLTVTKDRNGVIEATTDKCAFKVTYDHSRTFTEVTFPLVDEGDAIGVCGLGYDAWRRTVA
ncbi:uncharacterized protein LOC141914035 [Tubulanus polymorphus]|uniref:uncharacterized protein LOC141914035 n=1 Tax=Tubulanus polymorphus TaxID=672921 RepID=UPI003DA4D733